MDDPSNQGTLEPKYSYRNLDLWKQAQDFAQTIVELVDGLPVRRSTDSIARQIVRSATSVAANIAEGHGRFGLPSYRNHLSIAKGSACETDSWIDLLRRLGLISQESEADLHRRCSLLIASLTRRILELERMAPKRIREEPPPYETVDEAEQLLDVDGSKVQRFERP